MSKPLGMTAMFQIVTLHVAQDKVYEAVQVWIDNNGTVEDFVREAKECWRIYLQEKMNSDDKAFQRSLK